PLTITGISVSDPDAGTSRMRVTLSVNHGTLTVRTYVAGGLAAADVSGNGTGTVGLTGTPRQINTTLAAIAGLTYPRHPTFHRADTLTVTTSDRGSGFGPDRALTDTDTVALTIFSPEEQAQQLRTAVEDLVRAGVFNRGEGNSLTTKLKAVTNTSGSHQVEA